MSELEAHFDTTQLDRVADKAEAVIFNALRGAMDGILRAFESRHIKERMTGRPGLMRRTGSLARSWKIVVQGQTTNDLRGTYATNSRYARMQEYGGTQRPNQAKMLAIPLAAAKTGAGVARWSTPLRQILPAAFPGGTFVARTKSGALILFGKTEKGGDPIPLFVLKQQVVIPGRLGTRDLWRATQAQHQTILNGFVLEANTKIAEIARGGNGGT